MINEDVSWSDLKTFVKNRSLSIQEIDNKSWYLLYAIDGPVSLKCKLVKNDAKYTSDIADYEDNLKSSSNTPFGNPIYGGGINGMNININEGHVRLLLKDMVLELKELNSNIRVMLDQEEDPDDN